MYWGDENGTIAVLGEGSLENSKLCEQTPTICCQSPSFCTFDSPDFCSGVGEGGVYTKGPIFECDFKRSIGEALARVIGIIDAVQALEVNKIRTLPPEACITNHISLNAKIKKAFSKRLDEYSLRLIDNNVVSKMTQTPRCFIAEYAIQVSEIEVIFTDNIYRSKSTLNWSMGNPWRSRLIYQQNLC